VGKNPKNGLIARRHKSRRHCRTARRQGAWRRAAQQQCYGLWRCSMTRRRHRHPKSLKNSTTPKATTPLYNSTTPCPLAPCCYTTTPWLLTPCYGSIFEILSPRGPYVVFLLKKDQNAKIMRRTTDRSHRGKVVRFHTAMGLCNPVSGTSSIYDMEGVYI
jgi:hypothetical protein